MTLHQIATTHPFALQTPRTSIYLGRRSFPLPGVYRHLLTGALQARAVWRHCSEGLHRAVFWAQGREAGRLVYVKRNQLACESRREEREGDGCMLAGWARVRNGGLILVSVVYILHLWRSGPIDIHRTRRAPQHKFRGLHTFRRTRRTVLHVFRVPRSGQFREAKEFE